MYMKITEAKQATIKVTEAEYRIIQVFCKWLDDNLCCDDVTEAVRVFGDEELLDFEGKSPTGGNVNIEILTIAEDTRNKIVNDVLAEIGEYGEIDAKGNIVKKFPQLYEDFKNMMIKVGYRVDKDL